MISLKCLKKINPIVIIILMFYCLNSFAKENIALIADSIITSHVSPWEDLFAINNNIDPVNSNDKEGGAYGNWESGANGDWDWVEYNWDQLYVIYQSDIYWWTDDGGVLIPTESYLEYWDVLNKKWIEIPESLDSGNIRDMYNEILFDSVLTNKIRVNMTSSIATGILEWKVWGRIGEQIPVGSTSTIDSVLAKGRISTITITAKDGSDIPVKGYVFTLKIDVINDLPATNESYLINGQFISSGSFIQILDSTDVNGYTSFTVQIPDVIDPKDGISIQVLFNDSLTKLGEAYSIYEPGLTPPIISPDETDNTVDDDLELTFIDDADWRNAIQEINGDDQILVEGVDYEILPGTLVLKPSGLNKVLTTVGTKTIEIKTLAYENVQVEQEIIHGSINQEQSSAGTVYKLFKNTTTAIEITAADQFGNIIPGYSFKYDIDMINDDVTTNEEYEINGVTVSSDISNQTATETGEEGTVSIPISIPGSIDINDGISIFINLNDGTTPVDTVTYMNDGNEKEIVLQNAVRTNPDFSWDKTAQSKNFIVYWGNKINGSPTDPGNGDLQFDPNQVLNILEDLLSYMTDTIGFIDNADERNMSKYKHEIVMNETWTTGFTGWAFGGSADDKIGGMWIHPGATGGPATLAHEFTHMCQAMVLVQYPGYGLKTDYAGFFWESHANYMMAQYTKTYTGVQVDRFINTSMLHFSTTRHYYQNQYFIDYIADMYGMDTVNLIWRMADPTRSHPLTSLRDSVLRYSQDDLNDDFGYYAMKNVTWDYTNGPLIRKAISSINNIYIGREYTILDSIPDGTGEYVVPRYMAPGDYGYNIIPLYPDDGALEITIDFKGYDNEPAGGAGWRYGFVAVDNENIPRYSELYSAQENTVSFSITAEDSAIFFVVTGAPSKHHNYGWTTGLPKEYCYPYSIKISGALPAGHKDGYNSEKNKYPGAPHSNGGGWISSTATVDESVYVGPNVQVLGKASISENARIEDFAIVTDNAVISDNVIVKGNSIVGGSSVLSGNVIVEKTSRVYGTRLSSNVVITGSALVYFSTISNSAKIKDLAILNNVSLSGTVIIGGDAEEYTNCSKGTYLQMQTVRTQGCDGRINHSLNQEINPEWPVYQYPLGAQPTVPQNLTASDITFESVELTWDKAVALNQISGYYIIQNGIVVKTTSDTNTIITDLESSTTYTFSVQAFDISGNVSAKSNEVEIETLVSGIINTEIGAFRVYPNPAHENFIIETTEDTNGLVIITTLSGNIVYSDNIKNTLYLTGKDIGNKGLYIIQIITPREVYIKKLVIR